MNNSIYYTYAYLREDGTPYYIGRGQRNRAFQKSHTVKVPPRDRILFLKKNLTTEEADKHEIYMIDVFGRKCDGGILRNLDKGGGGTVGISRKGKKNGMYGRKHSPETIAKMRAARKGQDKGRKLSEEARKNMSAAQKKSFAENPERHKRLLEARWKS